MSTSPSDGVRRPGWPGPRQGLALVAALQIAAGTAAVADPSAAAQELARRHAPILFLPKEGVAPGRPEALAGHARLVYRQTWGDATERDSVTLAPVADLADLGSRSFWQERIAQLEERKRRECGGRILGDVGCLERYEEAKLQVERILVTLDNPRSPALSRIALDLTAVDLSRFAAQGADRARRLEPAELAEAVKQGIESSAPVCYVHCALGVKLSWAGSRMTRPARAARRVGVEQLPSRWDIVYYSLYFPFNLSTNLHESDWDAAIAVVVPAGGAPGPAFVVYFAHHSASLYLMPSGPDTLAGYVRDYLRAEEGGRDDAAWACAAVNRHPLVFVARGAHGAYAVPGLTLAGPDIDIGVLRVRLPFAVDVHQGFARLLVPADLGEADLDTLDAFLGGGRLGALEVTRTDRAFLEEQPWGGYSGAWGEPLPFAGWSGSEGFHYSGRVADERSAERLRRWIERAGDPRKDIGIIDHWPTDRILYSD